MQDYDFPIYVFNPLVVGLFLIVLIGMVFAVFRWPAIASPFMLTGTQVLGIIVVGMGFYRPGIVIYFISFMAVLAVIGNSLFFGGRPLGVDTPSIMLTMFMLFVAFASVLSPPIVRDISWQKTQMFGVLGVLPFMLGRTFATDDSAAWKTVTFTAWFGVFYAFYTAAIVLAGGYRTLGAGRFSSMGDPIGAGTIFGMAAIFMIAVAWRPGTATWKRLFLIAGALAAMLVTFATFSRGPFLALSLGLLTLFLVGRNLQTKILMAVIVPVIMLLVFAILAPEAAWERIVGRTIQTGDAGDLTTGRLEIYKETIGRIPESPFLGHGTASFSTVFGRHDKIGYPHNLFLELLYELGLVGLILFSIFLVAVLRRMRWFLKNEYLSLSLRRFYAGLFVHSILIFQFSSHFAERPAFWFACGVMSGPFLFCQQESFELLYEEPEEGMYCCYDTER